MEFSQTTWAGHPPYSPSYVLPRPVTSTSAPAFRPFSIFPTTTPAVGSMLTSLPVYGGTPLSIPITGQYGSTMTTIFTGETSSSVPEKPSLAPVLSPPLGSLLHSQFSRPVNWLPTTFDTFPPKSEVEAQVVPAETAEAEALPKHAKGPLVITYFPLKARALFPLLVAEVGGIPYEWKKVALEDWPPLKPTTPFGQLPVMEHGSIVLAQSSAIAAYIGRLAGLLGTEDADFAMSQMLVAQYEDMIATMTKHYYSTSKEEEMEKYFSDKLPSDLAKVEKLVSSGGFTTERTVGELAIFAFVNIMLDMKPDCLDGFPALSLFYSRLAADSKVSAFLAGKAGEIWYKKDW
eukprot:GGOE01036225.1.p1 GENE.GGOE01036225.1~~GGOE01036225.1.p1  ORF type:complete len:347 (+),score=42.96 GGOE01036225.1:27-1067(+)